MSTSFATFLDMTVASHRLGEGSSGYWSLQPVFQICKAPALEPKSLVLRVDATSYARTMHAIFKSIVPMRTPSWRKRLNDAAASTS